MFYKNTSYFAKTFYGVTFNPGETKEVNEVINNKWMIPSEKPINASSTTKVQQKPSPETKKAVLKEDEPKKADKESLKSSDNSEQQS